MSVDVVARGLAAGIVVTETLGTKLRRLARQARQNNPLIQVPLLKNTQWAAGVTVQQGNVWAANGNLYVCIQGGTTASSGTGPNSTAGGTIADGTAYWTWLGLTDYPAVNDASAPAANNAVAPATPVPVVASQGATGLSNWFYPVKYTGVFEYQGCYTIPNGALAVNLLTFNRAPPGGTAAPYAMSPAVRFLTNASKVAIGLGNAGNGTAPVRIIIDGRYLSNDGIYVGGTGGWVMLDFSAVGGARERDITLEFSNNSALAQPVFAGVCVDANSQVYAPPIADKVTWCHIEDSICAGSNYHPFWSGNSFPRRVAKRLGWSDPWNMAIGGTGYNNAGAGFNMFGDRIAEAISRNPQIMSFGGSTNDDQSAATQAKRLAALTTTRALGFTGPIIVFGLWSANNANVALNEPLMKAIVQGMGDPGIFFVPVYADPKTGPWVMGTWNNGGQNGNVSNTNCTNGTVLIGGDALHPTDFGNSYRADRAAQAIADQALPFVR